MSQETKAVVKKVLETLLDEAMEYRQGGLYMPRSYILWDDFVTLVREIISEQG